jgi:hypothetical protein
MHLLSKSHTYHAAQKATIASRRPEGDGHNWIFALQSAAKIRKVSLR